MRLAALVSALHQEVEQRVAAARAFVRRRSPVVVRVEQRFRALPPNSRRYRARLTTRRAVVENPADAWTGRFSRWTGRTVRCGTCRNRRSTSARARSTS